MSTAVEKMIAREEQQARRGPFGFPFTVTSVCPPDTIIFCHQNVVSAVQLSEAADRMAEHGILPQQTADDLRRDVEEFIAREAKEKRIGMIINIGTGK